VPLSDYGEKLVMDFAMTAEPVVRPTSWTMALYTVLPSDAGGGTEIAGDGYVRQNVTYDACASPGGVTQNNIKVTFTAAGGDWGTIVGTGVFDHLGNLIWHGSLVVSKFVGDGDKAEYDVGANTLTIS